MNVKTLLTLCLLAGGPTAQAQSSPPVPVTEQSGLTKWTRLTITSPRGEVVRLDHLQRRLLHTNAAGKTSVTPLPLTTLRRVEAAIAGARRAPFPQQGGSKLAVDADGIQLSSPRLRAVARVLHTIATTQTLPSSPDAEPVLLRGTKSGSNRLRRGVGGSNPQAYTLAFPSPGLAHAFERLLDGQRVSLVVYPFHTGWTPAPAPARKRDGAWRVKNYRALVVDLVLRVDETSGLDVSWPAQTTAPASPWYLQPFDSASLWLVGDPTGHSGDEIVWANHEQDPSDARLFVTDTRGRTRALWLPEKARPVTPRQLHKAEQAQIRAVQRARRQAANAPATAKPAAKTEPEPKRKGIREHLDLGE